MKNYAVEDGEIVKMEDANEATKSIGARRQF